LIAAHVCNNMIRPVDIKPKKRQRPAAKCWIAGIKPEAAVLCLLAFTGAAKAQNVLTPQPQFSTTPPAVRAAQNQEMEVFNPEGFLSALMGNPFQWGPVTLRPHVSYQFLYGNGIQSSVNQQQATVIQTFSPGLLFVLGDHWTLDYTPSWTFYSSKNFRDSIGHSVSFAGGTTYQDWNFGLSQSYSRSSAPLVETGTQTDTETFSTGLNASYRFSSKMSVDMGISQNFTAAAQFTSSRQWSTMEWLNYQFWPRLQVAAGVGGGYVAVDTGNDSSYEQFQGRVSWRATDKTSIQVHGGLEDRQFLGGGASDVLNPIFGVAIQYQPFEFTEFSLSADRSVSTSYLQNQNSVSTSINGSLNQRLFQKFSLTLGGGYSTVKYIATTSGVFAGRQDDYYSFNARLSRMFLKRGTISVTYQFSDNSSSQSGFTYSSSQVGLEVGFRY